MIIQKLAAPESGHRVETGVVQFGEDWPGVFIRGDTAFGMAMYLSHGYDKDSQPTELMDIVFKSTLGSLIELLQSSNINRSVEAEDAD